MKQEMMGWQWHQLDHLQIVCTSLQTDNYASTLLSVSFCTSQIHFLTPNQQCQSTEGKHIELLTCDRNSYSVRLFDADCHCMVIHLLGKFSH